MKEARAEIKAEREAPLSWYTPRMCVAVTQGTAIQGADATY